MGASELILNTQIKFGALTSTGIYLNDIPLVIVDIELNLVINQVILGKNLEIAEALYNFDHIQFFLEPLRTFLFETHKLFIPETRHPRILSLEVQHDKLAGGILDVSILHNGVFLLS